MKNIHDIEEQIYEKMESWANYDFDKKEKQWEEKKSGVWIRIKGKLKSTFKTRYNKKTINYDTLTWIIAATIIVVQVLLFTIPPVTVYIKEQNCVNGIYIFYQNIAGLRCIPIGIMSLIIIQNFVSKEFNLFKYIKIVIGVAAGIICWEILYDIMLYGKINFSDQSQIIAFGILSIAFKEKAFFQKKNYITKSGRKVEILIDIIAILMLGLFLHAAQYIAIAIYMMLFYRLKDYLPAAGILSSILICLYYGSNYMVGAVIMAVLLYFIREDARKSYKLCIMASISTVIGYILGTVLERIIVGI